MSHNNAYDHMVVVTDALTAVDYWRLDSDHDNTVNLARQTASSCATADAADLLPAANNNGSLYYDGSVSYSTITYDNLSQGANFPSGTSFTVEAWIKPASDQSATDVIGIAQKPGSFGIFLAYGCPTVFIQSNGDGTRTQVSSSTAVSSGSIYHIVGVYGSSDGATPTPHAFLKLYVNNSLVASSTGTITAGKVANPSGANFTIGSWDTSTLFFHGRISNVALYDGGMGTTQISNHYNYAG